MGDINFHPLEFQTDERHEIPGEPWFALDLTLLSSQQGLPGWLAFNTRLIKPLISVLQPAELIGAVEHHTSKIDNGALASYVSSQAHNVLSVSDGGTDS